MSHQADSINDTSFNGQDQGVIMKHKKRNIFLSNNFIQKQDKVLSKTSNKDELKKKLSLIDDVAFLSGSDYEDDDEDEEIYDNNYIEDGFVVKDDNDLQQEYKDNDDDLEDSDNDSHDSHLGREFSNRSRKRLKKGNTEFLDDDDLLLIHEAQGNLRNNLDAVHRHHGKFEGNLEVTKIDKRQITTSIKARSGAELRKELFTDSSDNEGEVRKHYTKNNGKKNMLNKDKLQDTQFDENDMYDFIDYGDEDGDGFRTTVEDNMSLDVREAVSEAQLNEASGIFGTKYLDFIDDLKDEEGMDESLDNQRTVSDFHERGIGVDLGISTDEDIEDDKTFEGDDDTDLIVSNDKDNESKSISGNFHHNDAQRVSIEELSFVKAERHRAAAVRKADRRKVRLRRIFEPIQLVENFCTDLDDEIRMKDVPERFFRWNTPFDKCSNDDIEHMAEEEEEKAMWILERVPDIASEYFLINIPGEVDKDKENQQSSIELKQRTILNSIIAALRYMQKDKLEPEFIRLYRQDIVTSPIVRENIYIILDADADWQSMMNFKYKTFALLCEISETANMEESKVVKKESFDKHAVSQKSLDKILREEKKIKDQTNQLSSDNNDIDKDLFGDDDIKQESKFDKNKKTELFHSNLEVTQNLVNTRVHNVSQNKYSLEKSKPNETDCTLPQSDIFQTRKKNCILDTCNTEEYKRYLSTLTDYRHVMDVHAYFSLLNDGNDAIRAKTSTVAMENSIKKKKRNRKFDRDYYRTCVSKGLRAICYRYVLTPIHVGFKIEGNFTVSHNLTLPLDSQIKERENNYNYDSKKIDLPILNNVDPTSFVSDLARNGSLKFFPSTSTNEMYINNYSELKDPLRGCRYVAAIELAFEPRVRRYLRMVYQSHAFLTTRPTSKGLANIDYFHEFYGLHLLRCKPIKEHFPIEDRELKIQKNDFNLEEYRGLIEKARNIEIYSCTQYMNLLKAEKDGHINIYIHLPIKDIYDNMWYKMDDKYFNYDRQDVSPLMKILETAYLSTNTNNDQWNKERKNILYLCLKSFLLPLFEREIRKDLRKASIKIGIKTAGKNLHTMAIEGPYRPSHLLGENHLLFPTGDLSVVGVCCSSDKKDATYLASVTERGELNNHLAIPSGVNINDSKMREKVITFLMQSRPCAILVGTQGGLRCRLISRQLRDLVAQATERWNNRFIQAEDEADDEFEARKRLFNSKQDSYDDEESEWKCNVDIVNDEISQLFGRSVRGKREFPDFTANHRCAISIARYVKDPLAELCYSWCVASDAGVFGTEMLYLNIHPMQQLLPKSLLLKEYERILCNIVAQVGVDVNLSCTYDHMHGLLTFIPGFGPRKAAWLKQSLVRIGGVVASRKDLLTRKLLGPIVYNNSVAFIRIREIDALSNQLLHPLDDTRLHPDVYHRNNWATKMAIDALELVEDTGSDNCSIDMEDLTITALRDVMENSRNEVHKLFNATKAEYEQVHHGPWHSIDAWDPRVDVPNERWRDKVEDLDLDTFADIIEQSGKGKWLSHLIMIKWEFRLPFKDPRKPMEPLDKNDLFRLLTNETDRSLCPGKEMTGKVVRNTDFGSRVILEGDIPGFIPLRNLADDHVESADDVVQVGNVITAIVTNVKKDHVCCDLSLRMEDFRKSSQSWDRPDSLLKIDRFFDHNAALSIEKEKSKEREERINALQFALSRAKLCNSNSIHVDSNVRNFTAGRVRKVTRRACAHPSFRNLSNNDVDKELKDGGEAYVGEALIRPSSKSVDSLVVHWMLRPGIIKLIEVTEKDKSSDISIGNLLTIKDEFYGSIDELLARFISPLNDRVEELLHHRKFVKLTDKDVDNKLIELKKSTPSGFFYFLCWDEQHAPYISLRYIINTVRNHPIRIDHDGYFWCRNTYVTLDSLLNVFKRNPHGIKCQQTLKSTSLKTQFNSKIPENRPSRWGARSHYQKPHGSSSGGWTVPVITKSSLWNQQPPLPPPPQYKPMPPMLVKNPWKPPTAERSSSQCLYPPHTDQ